MMHWSPTIGVQPDDPGAQFTFGGDEKTMTTFGILENAKAWTFFFAFPHL
jgi:hypothetical protein